MKPPAFAYLRATSIEHAIQALVDAGGDGKIIAGGQSLVPMLNFRLLAPSVLVDINRIAGLDVIEEQPDGGLRIGALTRHHRLETSPQVARLFPVLSAAMTHVAHLAIRNRGTIGGSLTHADPAAELPMLALLLDASIRTASPRGGRAIAAADFLVGPLTSAVEDDEIVVRIDLPALPARHTWAFEEFARRPGDYALAAVAVVLECRDGRIHGARIALTGIADTALRAHDAEALLQGQTLTDSLLDAVMHSVRAAIDPCGDLHASADYRRHLAGVLARRALRDAWRRALELPDEDA